MNIFKIINQKIRGASHNEEQDLIDFAPLLETAYNNRFEYNTDCDEMRVFYRSPFFPFESLIFHDKFNELKEIIFRNPRNIVQII